MSKEYLFLKGVNYFFADWTKVREIIGAFIEETVVTGIIKDSNLVPDEDKNILKKIIKIDDNQKFIDALKGLKIKGGDGNK